MNKRKVGERATIFFDNNDFLILDTLNEKDSKGNYIYPHGIGVLKLADTIRLKHKNLKPHLDKLRYLDLISMFRLEDDVSVEVTLTTPLVYYHDIAPEEITPKIKEELKNYEFLLEMLNKIRGYYFNKQTDMIIEFDIRKLKAKESKGVYTMTKKGKKHTH